MPYGRSLTYRFAQGGFWGALAFADVEALPWGVVKGLALRHLRWWAARPIFAPDGTLSIGYGYPNLNMAEQYNSPGSPYWALKFFLPLALADSHPFWQAPEQPLPDLPAVARLPHAGMVMMRGEPSLASQPPGDGTGAATHVVALTSGQSGTFFRAGAEKYAKFAYSTAFAFSVPADCRGLEQAAADSMLALADDGVHYRVREQTTYAAIDGDMVHSRWQPWPGVEVETWLIPVWPWHVRVHRLACDRRLDNAEGGFAIDRCTVLTSSAQGGAARVRAAAGGSAISDLAGSRAGRIVDAHPNTNLLVPRTAIPTLVGVHEPGEHWLACAVLADPALDAFDYAWRAGPPAAPHFAGLPSRLA